MPELKAIPRDVRESLERQRNEIKAGLDQHAKECPARIKAMKRAVDHDSGDHVNPFSTRGESTGQVDTTAASALRPRLSIMPISQTLVRWLLYLGLVIGSAIATLATTLGILDHNAKSSTVQTEHQGQPDRSGGSTASTPNEIDSSARADRR